MIVPMKLWANWAWFGRAAADANPSASRPAEHETLGLLGSFERLMSVQTDLVLKNLKD